MASSSKPRRNYDVFLSFRGTDVRNNFLGHLYKALERNGIYTFRDSEELRKGDQISPALMKAIEDSCIAIVIFSEDYASSWWCLEELAKIMECKMQNQLLVRPVFYKVEPREVRTGRQRYATTLDDHEPKHGKEKVKTWKEALFDAGSLSGWALNDEDESEVIQKIVEEISTRLCQTPLQVAKHPVGIDSRVVKLKSILNLKSDDGVLMLGLWGQGGIGKTSLAKALFNDMFTQFDGACFLEDVGGKSKDNRGLVESRGLVELQKQLLVDILVLQQGLNVSTVSGGINLIQRRLGDKRVLLILDNVDNLGQLDALAGDRKWFGNGSKIIVTTRDKRLLTSHHIDQYHVYEVDALNHTEAHELLSKHAFQTDQIRKGLVESALNYAKGIPLALVVLGSLLCGTTEDVWESKLKNLFRNPNKDINNVLKVSYDGLDENQQEIFLHIACFFKGQEREYTKKVLECCDLQPVEGFATLIERSLISIEYGILKVHDLIQAMGIDIVNQECKDDPRKRSRLWLYNDVCNVLEDNKGDCDVKAIVLKPPQPIEICIGPDAFTKMRKLRLLILHNVHSSSQDPICLPKGLRWLEWARCGHLILEFSSRPKDLVALDISSCSITVAPNQFKGFQNLKYLNVSKCESLVRLPDLWCAPNLQELNLYDCKNLVEAHKSMAYHGKLRVLNFQGCSELSVFPNELESKNLQTLNLAECTKFERFPDIPHKLEALREVYLNRTAIKGLPASIENLVSLKRMVLSGCEKLVSLPSGIYKLQNLEDLPLDFCTNLVGFPGFEDSTGPCMKTKHSNLSGGNVTGVVKQFKRDQHGIVLPGREMPEWVLPVEKDSISFMVSKDLYDKFLGCAFCVVVDNDNLNGGTSYYHFVRVNGKRLPTHGHSLGSLELDHINLCYFTPLELWGFNQIDGSHVQLSLTVSDKYPKKWGFRIFCQQLEDDLKVNLQDNRLIDRALLCEIDYESTYSEVKSLLMHEEDLRDHPRGSERDEEIASKREYGLIPPGGKPIATTSSSSYLISKVRTKAFY